MIEKLWCVSTQNVWKTLAFVTCAQALPQAESAGWIVFFALALTYYIFQLAATSTAYDQLKREGKL